MQKLPQLVHTLLVCKASILLLSETPRKARGLLHRFVLLHNFYLNHFNKTLACCLLEVFLGFSTFSSILLI